MDLTLANTQIHQIGWKGYPEESPTYSVGETIDGVRIILPSEKL
jgi:hypothetical protein